MPQQPFKYCHPSFVFVCFLFHLTPRKLHCRAASFTSWLSDCRDEATPPSGCCTSTSVSADLRRSLSSAPACQSAFALFAFRLKPLQIERTRQVRAPEESGWCPTSLCSQSLFGFSLLFLFFYLAVVVFVVYLPSHCLNSTKYSLKPDLWSLEISSCCTLFSWRDDIRAAVTLFFVKYFNGFQ